MKKLICTILPFLLTFGMSMNVFAVDKIDTTKMSDEELQAYQEYVDTETELEQIKAELEPDFLTELLKVLSKEDYAGFYIEDGIMHMIPINMQAIESALTNTMSKTKAVVDIVVDEDIAVYSLKDLSDAHLRLYEKMTVFDLKMIATNESMNSLDVYAYEWTDKKKQEALNVAEIDNINFIIYEDVPLEKASTFIVYPSAEGPQSKAPVIGRTGLWMADIDYDGPNGGVYTSTLNLLGF